MKKIALLLLTVLLVTVPVLGQPKSFDMRYQEAREYFNAKEYDKAIKVLETAKALPKVTAQQVGMANRLINQCRSQQRTEGDLNLSKYDMEFPDDASEDSLYVTALKKWSVTYVPDWCETRVVDDVLYVKTKANEGKTERKGDIEISMGKIRTTYLSITQRSKPDILKNVVIKTSPARARIFVDNNPGVLDDYLEMSEGVHSIRIEKEGFNRKDTTIIVSPGMVDEDLQFFFNLEPRFARLVLNILPEEGYSFSNTPSVDINGVKVILDSENILSFDSDQAIIYYHAYEGNIIPLRIGQQVLHIKADGYKDYTNNIRLKEGETVALNVHMEPLKGSLTIYDSENAGGAEITIDGKVWGSLPLNNASIITGHHVATIKKEGFVSSKDRYVFEVAENEKVSFGVSMVKFSQYHVTSDPAFCMVYLDGREIGSTPCDVIIPQGEHLLTVTKKGFFTFSETIIPDVAVSNQEYPVELRPVFPLIISSDVDSLRMLITQGRGDKMVTYVKNKSVPTTVNLPLSNSPYRIRLFRDDQSLAYNGHFRFASQNKTHLNVLSTSQNNFQIVKVNFLIKSTEPYFGATEFRKDFQRLGEVSLGKFSVFPGMSTNLVKMAVYKETNPSQMIHYPTLRNEGESSYPNIKFLPAFSAIFINEEFRMGGSLHNNVEVNMLATYAWYPSLTKMLAISHLSGHDIFLGGEVSSRMPIFNAHLKFGMQMFYGQGSICAPAEKESDYIETRFYSEPYKIPFQEAQFVVGLGFSLGSKDSKGNNLLRIF